MKHRLVNITNNVFFYITNILPIPLNKIYNLNSLSRRILNGRIITNIGVHFIYNTSLNLISDVMVLYEFSKLIIRQSRVFPIKKLSNRELSYSISNILLTLEVNERYGCCSESFC